MNLLPPASEIMAGLLSICERLDSILGRLKFIQQNNLDNLLIWFDYLATEEKGKKYQDVEAIF